MNMEEVFITIDKVLQNFLHIEYGVKNSITPYNIGQLGTTLKNELSKLNQETEEGEGDNNA